MNANYNALKEPRIGIMLHYDESTSDAGSLQWLLDDPTCKVSYTWIAMRDGVLHQIAPPDKRAWHAGVCETSSVLVLRYTDANSAFYGLAVAANHTEKATPAQFKTVTKQCVDLFRAHGWRATEVWRIVGHNTEAAPRGRKIDPDGGGFVVLSVAEVRDAVARALP